MYITTTLSTLRLHYIMLFKTYCTGLYGSSFWCSYKAKTLQKIKGAYNNVFRILMLTVFKLSVESTLWVDLIKVHGI